MRCTELRQCSKPALLRVHALCSRRCAVSISCQSCRLNATTPPCSPCRGSGLGSQLIRSLVQQAGATPIYLTTISQRMALYQRCDLLLATLLPCCLSSSCLLYVVAVPAADQAWFALLPSNLSGHTAFMPCLPCSHSCLSSPHPSPHSCSPFPLRRCGFEEVPRTEVPLYLQLEYFLGIGLAWLAARDRLVLMRLAQQPQGQQQGQQGQQQAAAAGAAAAVDAKQQRQKT